MVDLNFDLKKTGVIIDHAGVFGFRQRLAGVDHVCDFIMTSQ